MNSMDCCSSYLRASRAVRWDTCLSAVLAICISCDTFAGISTDNSLGQPAQTLTGPNYLIPETLGRLSGSNLFLSFQTFDILTGDSANFTTATSGIANVISRVTGGGLSQINGLLSLTPCTGCGAPNFFFINPAGVAFGAGASIDVPGAFHVSTADYVKFPDGNFSADLSQASSFSSAPPEAFGFLGTTRAPVTVKDGAVLTMKPSQPISIVAGDIEIDNGTVSTEGESIRVAALGQSAQEIGFTGVLPAADGNIAILNGGEISSSTSSATDAGSLKLSAGDIAVDGGSGYSSLRSTAAAGTGNAGSIEVLATRKLSVNDAFISSSTSSAGSAGKVKVEADSIALDGYGSISSSGKAGSVEVAATGNLSISENGKISCSTSSSSDAGFVSVRINAGSINIAGSAFDYSPSTSPGITSSEYGSTGNAGNVEVTVTGNLSIINGGHISTDTSTSVNAGSIKIKAGGITISATHDSDWSRITSNAGKGSTGKGGSVEVSSSGSFFIGNSSYIASDTYSSGDAGSVKVSANSIIIDGQDGSYPPNIGSRAIKGTGKAGSVEVAAAGNLSLVDGVRIISSTFSSGNAGSVKVNAGSITIKGGNSWSLMTSSAEEGSTGNAGSVEVAAAGNLSLVSGGQILSSTFSSGDAGSVKVNAGSLNMDGQGSKLWTLISSSGERGSTGNGGSVEVMVAGNLSITNGGVISSTAYSSGNAGSVKVNADSIVIDNAGNKVIDYDGHSIPTGILSDSNSGYGGTGNAGNVDVVAAGTLSIANGGSISSDTKTSGKAGSVKVSANTLFVDGTLSNGQPSSINASASPGSSGQTGSVDVNVTDSITLTNGGMISIQNDTTTDKRDSLKPTLLSVSAPILTLKDAQITAASTGNVAAGSIKIAASDKLYLDSSGITTMSNLGNGGAIDIAAGTLWLDNSQIATSVTGLTGNGGNIAINASTLVLNTGFIQANTAAANASGGTVSIAAQNLIPSGSTLFAGGQTPLMFQPGVFGYNVIQAAAPTGLSGIIQITAPVLDISGSLTGLNTQVIDTGGLSRSPCQATGGSSLAQSGRGGLPPSARGLLRAERNYPPIKNSNHAGMGADYLRVAFANWGCS